MTGGDAKPATAARIYDCYLGGTHNFPADRAAAKAVTSLFPLTPLVAQANRAFLRRAVRYLIGMGVRQFLDLGSGIPTEGNVHEVAQAVTAGTRVAYVDIDPVAVAESQQILQGDDSAVAIRADLRDPQAILSHPQVSGFLDFSRPVGVLLVAVLHFVHDDDQARDAVRQLLAAVPSGSALVMSHGVAVPGFDINVHDVDVVHDVYRRQTATQLRLRDREEFTRFFDGLELVPPGVVWLPQWMPSPGDPADFAAEPARCGMVAGVGRLP